MSGNRRQNWLLTVFPSIMLAIVMFGYFRPTSELRRVSKEAAARRTKADTELILKTTTAKRDELQAELKKLEQERTALLDRWLTIRKSFHPSNDRPSSLDKLTAVLLKHNLLVISKQSLSGTEIQLGKGLQQLEQRLKQPITGTFPELRNIASVPPEEAQATVSAAPPAGDRRANWEISFAGTYEDVGAALRQMVADDPSVALLSLEMDEARPELKMRRWKLSLSF